MKTLTEDDINQAAEELRWYGKNLHPRLTVAPRSDGISWPDAFNAEIDVLRDMALAYLKCEEDAKRWRKARTIFSIEDIERANFELRGNRPTEEENLKADAAIDAARKERA